MSGNNSTWPLQSAKEHAHKGVKKRRFKPFPWPQVINSINTVGPANRTQFGTNLEIILPTQKLLA